MNIVRQTFSTCRTQQAMRLFPSLTAKQGLLAANPSSTSLALRARGYFHFADPRATCPRRIVASRSSGFHSVGIQLREKRVVDGEEEGINQVKTDGSKMPIMEDDDHFQHQHQPPMPPNTDPKARMLIGFTCTVCDNRSHKTMSKHAYNHGVVIIQCDHCKNRHLIADHLGWFRSGGVTVEDLVKEKGETVQKLTAPYEMIKDGGYSKDEPSVAGTGSATGEANKTPEQMEFEKALEKAAEGMLEWIPKDVLELEKQRMEKGRNNTNTAGSG